MSTFESIFAENAEISEPKKSPETKFENPKNTATDSPVNSSQKFGDPSHPWGYDLYPERHVERKTGIDNLMALKGRENITRLKCERKVYRCIQKSPLVKLMMSALKSSGCAIDIRRHIVCEDCDGRVSGGYDPILNQIVVCQNVSTNKGTIQGVLTHEMIHMFDYCRNELDFKNIEHLACTEIRAANLTHCSFVSAWIQGDTSIFNVKKTHEYCVKTKALESIVAVRPVTREEAKEAIEKVFTKCYADLEPIGRRVRRNSTDMYKAKSEGYLYGYD